MSDEFPDFAGGDVRIVLTTGRQYQLHASILRNGSTLMGRLLVASRAAVLSSRAVKAGATTRWKLVLVSAPDEDTALQYRLSAVPLSDRGVEFRGSTTTIIVENENGRVADPCFRVCYPPYFPISGGVILTISHPRPLTPFWALCTAFR